MTEVIANKTTRSSSISYDFSHKEIARYSRHLIMPEVGMDGQKKLKAAKVLLVGAGGLGSPISMYLAAAGVGTIGIVDYDVVDYSNLQRQIIHSTEDVGRSKLESAKDTLKSINPYVKIELHQEPLHSSNALEIIDKYDIVCDGTDNFPTRYLVNDACVLLNKPNVYGSIFRFEGQASVFYAKKGPCYRCLYSEPPPPGLVPSCAEGGVLGVLPGLVGTIQATEIIKLILGRGEPLIGRLMLIDALDMKFRELKLRKNPNCVICSENATQKDLIDYEIFCGISATDEGSDIFLSPEDVISVKTLDQYQKKGVPYTLIDVREPHEQEISVIEGSILIPLNEVDTKIDQFNKNELIVLHCKTGIRSARALSKLKKHGFTNLKNLAGGINAWANQIDPRLAIY
ncbi:MAG: molybdopterin-synthase adenylyltransferase MoeB [Candidatus Kariarchaeaceae archaeon]|jgi:adenylyltransferase/sulfurtransferase